MLASSWGDPVIGIDVHFELVPTPAPVPTPIPNPFTGVIFDPAGLVVGLAISNAINFVTSAPLAGPVVYWGAIPATNTGTEAKHVPGHILIPPGTAWAPFPKTPKPVIHPDETPKPPNPVKPDDDAICVFGSKTVTVMGSNAVRLGDLLMSCAEPVRLPSSVVMAVPKGPPILIGGPPSLDLMAAVFASLRTRFMSDSLHALISRMRPSRFRNFLHRAACFLTGHPVDVATGRVVTAFLDIELPGPLPLRIERAYSSAFASRRGPLGHGWSLSLDQAVWEERGKVVLLDEDGRELEFDTFDLPDHRMRPGDEAWYPMERLTLRRGRDGGWEVEAHDGVRREFMTVPGRDDGRAMIRRIRSRGREHGIEFHYDARGRLERVRDSGGRVVLLEYDREDRVAALDLPAPAGSGRYVHRRFAYDGAGDLVRVTDPQGAAWEFEYASHLLTRETDRAGLSFFFGYDGTGEDAWCVRTWGDGGIFDHAIAYDKKGHATYVTDSRGFTTQYHMNLAGLVTRVVDPLGGVREIAYDERTLQKTREADPSGDTTSWEYDERGNLVRTVHPDGSAVEWCFNTRNQPVSAVNALGGRWEWEYDGNGDLAAQIHPTDGVTSYGTRDGLLAWAEEPGYEGRPFVLEYSAQRLVTRAHFPAGGLVALEHDALGRVIRRTGARGGVVDLGYDLAGRVTRVVTATGAVTELAYDAEERLRSVSRDGRVVHLDYGGYRRVVAREEAGTLQRYDFDTEGRLVAVLNEAGEVWRFERDACGRVVGETAFDGHGIVYRRDAGGRIVETRLSGGRTLRYRYRPGGQVERAEYGEGEGVEFEYGAGGLLRSAQNEGGRVEFTRNPAGSVVGERWGDFEVTSGYGPGGKRTAMRSSLGAQADFRYDAEGRFVACAFGPAAGSRAMVIVRRGPDGLEERRELPGTVTLEWGRDAAGRPLERRPTNSGPIDSTLRYRWRGMDQVVEFFESIHGTTRYAYDGRGRMVAALGDRSAAYRVRDDVGNVYYAPDASDRRYGPGGRLVSARDVEFAHDEEGNLLFRRQRGGGVWRYRWNRAGLLAAVERPDGRCVRFEYDAIARRTAKTVVRRDGNAEVVEAETRFFWDGEQLVHQLSSGGGLTTWYWEPDGRALLGSERGGRWWTVASDPLGTPTEMYDESGALVWQMRLDIHGVPSFPKGSAADCPFRWPGQYHDEETGLYYNRFRYYDPGTGTYISPDPLRLRGGLNVFAYVDDVNTQVDPTGLHVIEAFLDGQPLINPATGTNHWPNVPGSGPRNVPAPSGYGRLGDSENVLMEYLRNEVAATFDPDILRGRTLTINSLGEPRMNPAGSPLPPCHLCHPGLQKFANDFGVTIHYTTQGQGRGGTYTPCA